MINVMSEDGKGIWEDMSDVSTTPTQYHNYELDFIDLPKDLQYDEPDYWTKLKHQYAGIAMQGMLSDKEMFNAITDGVWPPNRPAYIAARCDEYATALVNRFKEENKNE